MSVIYAASITCLAVGIGAGIGLVSKKVEKAYFTAIIAGTFVFMSHTFYTLVNSEKEDAEDGEYSEDEENKENVEHAESDYPTPIAYNFNFENGVKNRSFA